MKFLHTVLNTLWHHELFLRREEEDLIKFLKDDSPSRRHKDCFYVRGQKSRDQWRIGTNRNENHIICRCTLSATSTSASPGRPSGGFPGSSPGGAVAESGRLGFRSDGYEAGDIIRTLHKIGLRPPRPFNPKRDKNFDNWLSRDVYNFALVWLKEDRCMAALLLHLDPDAIEIGR